MLIGKSHRWAARSNAWQWAYGMLQNTHCAQLDGFRLLPLCSFLASFLPSCTFPLLCSLFILTLPFNSTFSPLHLWLGFASESDKIAYIPFTIILLPEMAAELYFEGRVFISFWWERLLLGNSWKRSSHSWISGGQKSTHGHHLLLAPFFLSFHQSSIHIPIYPSI